MAWTADGGPPRAGVLAATWPLFCGVAGSAATIDLVTKSILFSRLGMPGERPGVVIVRDMLTLETNLNEGALFGMGQGMGLVFAAISVAAIVGIVGVMFRPATRTDPWLVLALSLITGGIVGNLYDRLGLPGLRWHGPPNRVGEPVLAVRDWIHFRLEGIIDWPIFNLADTWLVIGAAVLVLVSLRQPPEAPATP